MALGWHQVTSLVLVVVIAIAIGAAAYPKYSKNAPGRQPLVTGQPALPTSRATDVRVAQLLAYYKQTTERCPQLTLDPALEKEFPNLRQSLAILKYVMETRAPLAQP